MLYLSHQTLDTDHGIILDVAVTPGDKSDIEPFLPQMERVRELLPVQAVTADSAYNSGLVQHEIERMGIAFYARPRKAEAPQKTAFTVAAFSYDLDADSYTCPMGEALPLRTLERNRHGLYWVYRAKAADCRQCPEYERCVSAGQRNQGRRLMSNYFQAAKDAECLRRTAPKYRDALHLRQIWCEGALTPDLPQS